MDRLRHTRRQNRVLIAAAIAGGVLFLIFAGVGLLIYLFAADRRALPKPDSLDVYSQVELNDHFKGRVAAQAWEDAERMFGKARHLWKGQDGHAQRAYLAKTRDHALGEVVTMVIIDVTYDVVSSVRFIKAEQYQSPVPPPEPPKPSRTGNRKHDAILDGAAGVGGSTVK